MTYFGPFIFSHPRDGKGSFFLQRFSNFILQLWTWIGRPDRPWDGEYISSSPCGGKKKTSKSLKWNKRGKCYTRVSTENTIFECSWRRLSPQGRGKKEILNFTWFGYIFSSFDRGGVLFFFIWLRCKGFIFIFFSPTQEGEEVFFSSEMETFSSFVSPRRVAEGEQPFSPFRGGVLSSPKRGEEKKAKDSRLSYGEAALQLRWRYIYIYIHDRVVENGNRCFRTLIFFY